MTPQRIMDLANAFFGSCVLFRAVDAGIFAHLAKTGAARAEELATACHLNRRAARLLLDACVALDLLRKDGPSYRNSPEATAFLVPGAPGDLSGALRYNRDVYPLWGKLDEFLHTGRPVERPQVHLGEHPQRTRDFVLAMHGRAMALGKAVIPRLSLHGNERLLDLGGGSGAYSILAAQAYPGVRATVLDLPEVAAVAEECVKAAGLSDRIACLPADYHNGGYPEGFDLALLFGMLHQEPPDSMVRILRQTRQALRPGGRVAVLDMMTDPSRSSPVFSALFGLNMALSTEHGWVFSDQDLAEWFQKAGFHDFECAPLPPPLPHWLAMATKANPNN